jgi:methionyl aminopeptidase
MTADSPEHIKALRNAGRMVRQVFEQMKAAAKPGVTTAELDAIAIRLFDQLGAQSAPQLFYEFPGATCISVNEEAAHGIPGPRRLRDGDMLNIDVSAKYQGVVADMGESFVVGRGRRAQQRICDAVRKAVTKAIAEIKPGRSLNVIGQTVQKVADRMGYKIVENLGSHGVGETIHEEPSYIPLDNPRETRRLTEGLVLTVEPFFTTGPAWVDEAADGWTLKVPTGELVAQFEQTVIVSRNGPIVVTAG